MRKKPGCWIAFAIVILLGVIGFAYMSMQRAMAEARKPKPVAQKVERGELKVQVIESGTIDAVRVVEVKSRVAGRVARLLVEEGDRVSKGQLIAVIDPQETELRVEQDRAQLRGARSAVARTTIEIEQRRVAARARLDQALSRVAQLEKETGVQPALTRSTIDGARSALSVATQALEQLVRVTQPNEKTAVATALDDARRQHENAELEARRREELLGRGFVSEREKQAADLDLSLARTRLRSAEERMARLASQQDLERRTAEERVRQARSELQRAEAGGIQPDLKREELASARAALRDAQAGLRDVDALIQGRAQTQAQVDQIGSVLRDSERQLGETEIRSPIDGVVTKKLIQEGELVASLSSFSSGTPIVRVEDRSAMLVKMNINEIDVAKLRLGTKSEITIDAIPSKTFNGRVTKISPSSQTAANPGADPVVRYAVEVTLDGREESIKSGMTAKCTMIVLRKQNVLLLPSDYVGKDDEGRFIMLPAASTDSKAKATRQAVQVGAETAAQAEIVSGAKEGQAVERPNYAGPKRRGMTIGGGARTE